MAGSNLTKALGRSFLVCILTLLATVAQGQSFSLPRIRETQIGRAYEKLRQANVFNFGGVGWGQEITPEERAFNTLFESLDSIRLFQRLINEANPEGQMYGLFGLHLTDSYMFRAAADQLRAKDGPPERLEQFTPVAKGKVRTARGCIFLQENREALIDQITKGEWDTAFRSHPRIFTH